MTAEQLWEQDLEGTTERLQMVGEDVVIRTSNRSIEARAVETGNLIWSVARDGARAVQISHAAGSPWIMILHRFDRPPPSSGRSEGSSWRLSLYREDAPEPIWVSSTEEGDALDGWLIPEQDRIALLVRNDQGKGTLTVRTLTSGRGEWNLEYGIIDAVPLDERVDGATYFTTSDNLLFRVDRREPTISLAAHDLSNGDLKWVGYLRGEDSRLRLISRDGNLFATGRMFTAIDPATGSVLWQHEEPWELNEARPPWLLVRHVDGGRLQLIHLNSGEKRWRSAPRTAAGIASVVGWFQEGLLIGSERGETALYGISDARRQDTERARYRAPGRGETEQVHVLTDGLLFVRTGPGGNVILRTDTRGGTRWLTDLSVPGLPTRGERRGGEGPATPTPAGLAVDGSGGTLWVTGQAAGGPVIVPVDLLNGREGESLALNGMEPFFAVCESRSSVIFVTVRGTLAACR